MIDPDVERRLLAETTQAWAPPDVTDLGIGQPNDGILPVEILDRAAAATLGRGVRHPLQYGTERGDGHLRLALARFLAPRYGGAHDAPVEADPSAMLVTNGNSHALDLLCAALTEPGDTVLVEDPTYHLALGILRDHGLRTVGVPVDDGGLSIEALELALAELSAQGRQPRLLYTVPAYHNPTGATLSDERRRHLVALALEHGFWIVADEVYHLLRYRADPGPAPMAAHVDSGVVLSLGTFSKILAPGLRLGWLQGPEELVAGLTRRGVMASGGGFNPFTAAVVAPALDDGSVARYLDDTLRPLLAHRAAVMAAALRAHVPPEVAWSEPDGGYFFWLRFPDGTDTARWLQAAAERKVGFRPGSLFSVSGRWAERMRLSFCFYDADAITPAVALLGQAIAATSTEPGR